MKTFNLTSKAVQRNWVVIDASSAPLGRVASTAAKRLIGKYKPSYTPHIDDGDNVIIINAGSLVTTGHKDETKMYHHHSGFPGGIKTATLSDMKAKNPIKIIELAVKGMLPRNKLAQDRMARLRVFVDANHSHEAQKPIKVEVS